MSHVIDWAAKPAPWCWIGPRFREECRAINSGRVPPVARPVREGHKLYERRLALRMTQAEIAGIAGVSITSLRNVEADRATARTAGLVRAALAKAERRGA